MDHPMKSTPTLIRWCAVLVVAAGTTLPGVARADELAEQAYQEGRRAALAKDWTTACAKFRESHDREPAPGTLLNLADCEENAGKLLDALAHFEAASRLSKPGTERATYASQRALAVERKVPRLTLRLHPSAPTRTRVVLDGTPLEASRLGTPSPVNPGEHEIVITAPDRADVRSTVRLAVGEARVMDVDVGPALSSSTPSAPSASLPAQAPSPLAAGASSPAPQSSAPESPAPSSSSPLRTLGWVGVGVGAAGVGLGVLSGLLTLEARNTADQNCTSSGCLPAGTDAQSRGRTWSGVSTFGFVTGVLGAAAGVTILALAPSRRAGVVAARSVDGGAQVEWSTRF